MTGGNTGIGYETVLHLALHGAKVYLATRSAEKAADAIARIKQQRSTADVEFVELDLSRLESVRKAAERLLEKDATINILICNAGTLAQEYALTDDGIETGFQCNYLGMFL